MASHLSTVRILIDYAEAQGAKVERDQEKQVQQQSPQHLQRLHQQHRPRQKQKHGALATASNEWWKMSTAAIKAERAKLGGLDISSDDDRALRYAAQGGDTAMVKLLLEYGANVHSAHDHALLVACKRGHTETVRALIQAGADFDLDGLPLRYATEQGHLDIVRLLCESGAGTHWGGCIALRGAAQRGQAQIIATLLDHGADVNIHEGMPLQLACQHGHEEAVKVLLEYGADHRLEEGAAYRYALERDHERIMSMLIDAETRMRAKEQQEEEEEAAFADQGEESLDDDDDDFIAISKDLRHPPAYLAMPQSTSSTPSSSSSSSSPSSPWPGRGFSLRPSIASHTQHTRAISLSSLHGHPASAPRSPISSTVAASPYQTHYQHRPMRTSSHQPRQVSGTTSALHRGHKRFYSQISSSLAIVDLLRTGSLCGLVALDDEIRSRQRNDHQRL
ncbi:hypothetical protein BGZ73_006362 [Actinomortierella ambigua]|nr:hypothetical protein BGZ73_006362 [Actinomortierella ambigua]